MGQLANEVRAALEAELEAKGRELEAKALEARLEAEALDVTVPGKPVTMGHRHPMYIALDELKDIFIGMGFTVLDGPEVELAEYNFDKLNAEEGHPSRDWSDTFYFDAGSRVMLRSQTSPMQVRAMETMELPIRIIAPGRVYRKDEVDATHSPMFHQVEGMVIDKGVTMADLKGTLNAVIKAIYGANSVTRFRPHHFPFTEPSCEMDVQCHKCGGVGCPTCKGEGWIELLGAGMVHPKVLKMAGIDPEEVITCRPADNIAPELETYKEQFKDIAKSEEDVLSLALFPQVAPKFLAWRDGPHEAPAQPAEAPKAPPADPNAVRELFVEYKF